MKRRAFLVLLALAGCRGCHEDHPYVPYSIGSATPRGEGPDGAEVAGRGSVDDAAVEGGTDPFSGEVGNAAPVGLSQWTLDGMPLTAPEGLVFVLGIVRDFDGDGAKDAFALVRPPDGNDPGKVIFYHGGALGAPMAFEPPSDLARDPSCTPIGRLELVGARSVLAELGQQCPLHPSSAPVRWLAVFSAASIARIRLAVTLADPGGAPALSIDADASDRDADGRDDVALRASLEGGGAPLEPGPRVSATMAWLDRSAGLSREPSTTEASFALLASTAAARAARLKEAPAVPGYVRQAQALWRAICAEGGAPRLVGVVGAGTIGCAAGHALETLGMATVHAYTVMGDPLRASLALDRAERPPATRTSARAAEAQGWIAQLAPLSSARAIRAIAAIPIEPHGHEPTWGSLAFEPDGKLLVRSAAGVVRVDPDQGDESAAGGGVDWKAAVTSPDASQRWIEAYDPCDGLPLRATFASATGDDSRDVGLPVPPSLTERCAGSRGAPARALPFAWGPRGLEAIVEAEPILFSPDLSRASLLAGFLDQPSVRGSPRSPDGKNFVVPTGVGLLAHNSGASRLLRARELDGSYGDQRACTISDDGTHVACVRAGRAWVGAWP